MKKHLGAALCAALMFPSGPVSAELLKNLKMSGGIDVRTTSARNIQDFATRAANDRIDNTQTRTYIQMDWDLLDDVHSKVMLRKNDRAWASTGGGGQGANGNQALVGGTQTGDIASNVYVQQANMKIDKVFGMWDTTIGRQFYGEPGDLIAHWGFKPSFGLTVTAVDAFRFDGMNDWMSWSALLGRTTGGSSALATTPTASVNVYGLEAMIKDLPLKVNPFIWYQNSPASGVLGKDPATGTALSPATSGKNDNLWVFGARLKAEGMGAWIKADLALNMGENRNLTAGFITPATDCDATGCTARGANYSGRAALINLGYKMDTEKMGAWSPWATFGYGSGRSNTRTGKNEDFQGIASSSRFGIMYGRFTSADSATLGSSYTGMDGVTGVSRTGLTNRVITGVGIKHTCPHMPKATMGLAYWNYRYQKATSRVGATTAQSTGNRAIGSEIDVTFDWKHSDNVMLSLGVASFQPGGYIKEAAKAAGVGANPSRMVQGDVSVKF